MRNIIITGGELFNKGAQAMTFIAVDELKRRFPDHSIFVLSEMDFRRPKAEKDKYSFQFLGWYPVKFAEAQANIVKRTAIKLRHKRELEEAEEIYKNTDLMIDISGYALGSNWGIKNVKGYVEHMLFAKYFHIPMYLMPQSFGPFDFQSDEGRALDSEIATLLPEMKMICAREQESYDALKSHYNLNNVNIMEDIVLSNCGIQVENIYTIEHHLSLPEIMPRSIAIIPNIRTLDVRPSSDSMKLYEACVKTSLELGYNVYLISHSEGDIELCRKVKASFIDNAKVCLVDQEFDCIELNELMKQFEFVIGSRYHSLVHAYKNSIPCIALGWAQKYQSLLTKFGQTKYWLDVRNAITEQDVEKAIKAMTVNREKEIKRISDILHSVQAENVFDVLRLDK